MRLTTALPEFSSRCCQWWWHKQSRGAMSHSGGGTFPSPADNMHMQLYLICNIRFAYESDPLKNTQASITATQTGLLCTNLWQTWSKILAILYYGRWCTPLWYSIILLRLFPGMNYANLYIATGLLFCLVHWYILARFLCWLTWFILFYFFTATSHFKASLECWPDNHCTSAHPWAAAGLIRQKYNSDHFCQNRMEGWLVYLCGQPYC